MGEKLKEVALLDFQISLCKVANYTVKYQDVKGTTLQPKSITFDDITKKFSIYSLETDPDVIPPTSDSSNVTVVITAHANSNLTASTNFTVTLTKPKSLVNKETVVTDGSDTTIEANTTVEEDTTEYLPFFQVLGNSTATRALPISMAANETTLRFDLGLLMYPGDPQDALVVNFDDKSVPFAKVDES